MFSTKQGQPHQPYETIVPQPSCRLENPHTYLLSKQQGAYYLQIEHIQSHKPETKTIKIRVSRDQLEWTIELKNEDPRKLMIDNLQKS